jgi:hypothetical protein
MYQATTWNPIRPTSHAISRITNNVQSIRRFSFPSPLLVDDDVAAAGAERHLHGVGEPVHAALKVAAGVLVELQDLGH